LAALLAIQVPAVAQTNGDTAAPAPGTSKQAEYDCSGMTWTARDNCLKLNADNARAGSRPVDNNPRGATHDCSGMIGAALETCRMGGLQRRAVPRPLRHAAARQLPGARRRSGSPHLLGAPGGWRARGRSRVAAGIRRDP